jgi:hypothetical protein
MAALIGVTKSDQGENKIGSGREIDLGHKQTSNPTRTAISEEIGFAGSEICEVVMDINDDLPTLR